MQNVFIAISLLIIASFIITFLMTYRKTQKKMHITCNASILGRVEDFEISHHQGQKLYTEVCTYEINKRVYTKKSSKSSKNKSHEIGDEILIYYEPQNPNNAFIAHDVKMNTTTDIVLWTTFVLCTICGIIMF